MDEEMNEYIIPENVGMSDSFGRYKIRNVVETVLFTLLSITLITRIPFVSDVKVIVTVIVTLAVFFLFLTGIKDESVTAFVIGYFRFKAKSSSLKLRVAGLTKTDIDTPEYRNNFEKYKARVKKRYGIHTGHSAV